MEYKEYKEYFQKMHGPFLKGKVAVVTGAARGIGAATAIVLADLGAKVVCAYLGNDEGANKVKNTIIASGGECITFKGDLSENKEAKRLADLTFKHFKGIDILVNNLGINASRRFLEVTEEEWDRFMAVNLKSMYNTCQHFVPYMMEQRKGKIINLTSTAGKEGALGPGANYSASKGGIIGFTRSCAIEFALYNINVNSLCPGTTDTRMIHWRTPEQLEEFVKNNIPIKRIGTCEEVAWGIAFLASEFADNMCGYVMDVNGGVHID